MRLNIRRSDIRRARGREGRVCCWASVSCGRLSCCVPLFLSHTGSDASRSEGLQSGYLAVASVFVHLTSKLSVQSRCWRVHLAPLCLSPLLPAPPPTPPTYFHFTQPPFKMPITPLLQILLSQVWRQSVFFFFFISFSCASPSCSISVFLIIFLYCKWNVWNPLAILAKSIRNTQLYSFDIS